MAAKTKKLDASYHDRRLARRLKEDPEFRAEFERQRRAIAQIDGVVRQLDQLRESAGLSKAALARQIGKDPASIRRLFTAEVNPELKTVAALASALGAEVKIVSRRRSSGRKRPSRSGKTAVAG
jgi:ribosome-binding protein aMBF1 (putative translation factor)